MRFSWSKGIQGGGQAVVVMSDEVEGTEGVSGRVCIYETHKVRWVNVFYISEGYGALVFIPGNRGRDFK